jgi:glyoxylase-like metal-dependent hydrolase (beta-lactamase superfamily II)
VLAWLTFPGGLGKTADAEKFGSLMDDLETRVFAELPDDTWFHPGHGDDSTLGEQHPHWRSGVRGVGDRGGLPRGSPT